MRGMCALAHSVTIFASFASKRSAIDFVIRNESILFLGLGLLHSSILHLVFSGLRTRGVGIGGWRHFDEARKCDTV